MHTRQVGFGTQAGPIGLVFEHLASAENSAGSTLVGTARMRRGQQVPLAGASTHPADEYSYVLSGQVEIEIGGQVHLAGPGTFMLIPAGECHVTRAVEDAEVLWWWVGRPQDFADLKAAYPTEATQMAAGSLP
jgi:ethanolamine utilization protein EutQ (cupin superfamily)